MIRFSAARLEKETIELQGEEKPEFLQLAADDLFACTAPVAYHLKVEHVPGGAVVRGSCRTEISGACGRCLEPVTADLVAGDLSLFLEIAPGTEEVDVSEDVREELLLELPMILLCRADCRGLCPVCGGNLNRKKCSCKTPDAGTSPWGALDDLQL